MDIGVGIARKAWLEPGDILNAGSADDDRRVRESPALTQLDEIIWHARRNSPPSAKAKRKPRRRPEGRRAPSIYDRLLAAYPDAHCALDFTTPFQLLVATILSAQCTDKRVNMVTPALFKRYPTPEALASANVEELEESDRRRPALQALAPEVGPGARRRLGDRP